MIDIEDVRKSIEKLGELDIPERLTLVENIRSVLKKDPRYQTVETCYQALLMLTNDKKWVVR